MAMAYVSIVSLIDLIDQIPAHQARLPTLFMEKQLGEMESIREKACFIQDYLETHLLGDSDDEQDLKRRVLYISNKATCIIESHILGDIKASTSAKVSDIFSSFYSSMERDACLNHLSEVIHKVLHFMDFIMKEMMQIEDVQPNNLTTTHSSITHPTMYDRDTHVVGFDDRVMQIMDKLTGQQPALQIIPITGMGGIGKTTLAQTIYNNSLIVQSFDIRGWVTISLVYNIEQILSNLLHGFNIHDQGKSEYHDLGQILRQHLLDRKYLIVVDDLWNTEAWDKLQLFLPNTKGSRIIVTTRLKEVANYVGSEYNIHEIKLLDKDNSWSLLCLKIFGKEGCPCRGLEEVGKKIAKSCRGLPLSIVVIGGLLRKSEMTIVSWENVADDVNRIITSEDSNCSDILLLSYKHLPIHLRPCFLYMRAFPENKRIRVSELVTRWVANGFLKPNKFKTLEEVAEEYLKDLNERHLIMIDWGSLRTMKTCKIHDLWRDLCIREAEKEKFILGNEINLGQSKRFLRILTKLDDISTTHDEGYILNLRYLRVYWSDDFSVLSKVHLLWNLQTLVIVGNYSTITLQVWKMLHLRHLICHTQQCYINIDDPQPEDSALENLQTLKGLHVNFGFSEEISNKIPNVKTLAVRFGYGSREYYNSFGSLLKLQSLTLQLPQFYTGEFVQNSIFPDSLKKLVLVHPGHKSLEEITERIGWLPHLEKLTISSAFTTEYDWNPVEGQFLNLRVLKLEFLRHLVNWNADSTHFPALEHLHLSGMSNLKEIPCGIGEIETLESITLFKGQASAFDSAKEILENQNGSGNENFRLIKQLGSELEEEALVYGLKVNLPVWPPRKIVTGIKIFA